MIAISLSPNTQKDDIRRAWRVLTNSSLQKEQEHVTAVAHVLSRYLQGKFVCMTSSGRQALYDILRAKKIRKGDEVIIQAFTCVAVPAPVIWAGATPVYADIDPKTYNIDPKSVEQRITPRTKAIIVQHTFGIPGPMEELSRIAKKHKILLIEDCAHGLGATLHGKRIGTLGDVSFFSFGRDKVVSCVYGGAIATSDQALLQTLQRFRDQRSYPPKRWVIQQAFHPILLSFAKRWYNRMHIGKIILRGALQLGLISRAVEAQERAGKKPRHIEYRFSPALAYLLAGQLDILEAYTKRRQMIAQRYMEAIPVSYKEDGAHPSWLRFPMHVQNPSRMHAAAKKQGIVLGDWYDTPLAPAGCDLKACGYEMGMCPNAEEACAHVVNLPTYPTMTDRQVEHVISFVRTYLKTYDT